MALTSSESEQSAVLLHLSSVLWNNESMSDVTLKACGRKFHLHKVLVLQSSKLKRSLEQSSASHTVIEWEELDAFITAEGIELALGSLYGRQPSLESGIVKNILAAASFLELEDLARCCVMHLGSQLDRDSFVSTLNFAASWEQGGEWGSELEAFCWKYLFRTAFRELRPVLTELAFPQLERLFTADELWVPTELDRFRLIIDVLEPRLLEAKEALSRAVVSEVLNDVVENVCGMPMLLSSHQEASKKGVKRAGTTTGVPWVPEELGPKKQCSIEMHPIGFEHGKSVLQGCGIGFEGVDPIGSHDSTDDENGIGWPVQAGMDEGNMLLGKEILLAETSAAAAAGDGLHCAQSSVLFDTMVSLSETLNIANNVMSGEEGLLYGSMGFGALLGVRGTVCCNVPCENVWNVVYGKEVTS